MMLIFLMKIPRVPVLTLYWNTKSTVIMEMEAAVPRAPLTTGSLSSLRSITQLWHQSTHSDHTIVEETDFAVLFSPDVAEEQLSGWFALNRNRTSALDLFRSGQTTVSGFVRTPSFRGSPFIFCDWHIDNDEDCEAALRIDCLPLPRRRNFEAPITLSKGTGAWGSGDTLQARALTARDCTVDNLHFNHARFGLFIPSILQHIEVYTIADQLQETILATLRFHDLRHAVTAIIAPSAMLSTSYQAYEFIGDAILKFTASVHLFARHSNWPEGYLSKRRDSLVSNNNLARAASSVRLEPYIVTEMPKRRKWAPPRVSDAERTEGRRELAMKVLADVTEALIGAAFLDSGFSAARACINLFVPDLQAIEPETTCAPPKLGVSACVLEVESLIGYQFRNKAILLEALTHPTYSTDATTQSYQRLEFLGDAILDLVIITRLSRCEPALSQGRMTRLKAALVNAALLGFICMKFGIERDVLSMKEDAPDVFVEVGQVEKVPLWKYMRHQSSYVVKAQEACGKRYCQQSSEIQRRLDRIGLSSYADRMIERQYALIHPRDALQQLVGSSNVDLIVEQYGDKPRMFRCRVKIDGVEVVEVEQCMTRDEAIAMGADAAVACLSHQ